MANFLMCCAALFWGATFIAQKTGMETIGPMGFTFGRYVIGAAILLPLAILEMTKVNLYTAARQNRQIASCGPVAEWLCSGLQNRLHRFNSGPGLHHFILLMRLHLLITASVMHACGTPNR